MKTFAELLPSFLATIKIKTQKATYISYVSKSNLFSEWLTEKGFNDLPMSDIDDNIIEQFSVHLANDKGLDRPTCMKYKSNLLQIFKYAMARGEVVKLPFDLFILPQKGKDCSAQVIPKDHNKVLLEDIKRHDRQLYLACMTEFYAFLRPGKELRLLKVGDIDFSKGTISVSQENAKNGKKRIVTMPNQLIEEYKEQKIDKADRGLYVFGAKKKPNKAPCSVNMLGYRFRKYRDRNGLSKGYTLYSFKHSGASLLHNQGNVSMIELMNQLGHSNLNSSQHYIHRIGGVVDVTIKNEFPNPY